MDFSLSRRGMLKAAGATAALGAMKLAGAAEGDSRAAATGETPAAHTAADLGGFSDGKYVLPPLPYAADALEPLYDGETLRLHHDKHHAAYVKGLNDALDKLAKAQKDGDLAQVKPLLNDLAFNGSGHVLHMLFWNSMAPGGKAVPSALEDAMKREFGSAASAQAVFAEAAKTAEGSGWAVLAWEPLGRRLVILQAEKHQDHTIWGVQPLLVCDVWEHAYYLKYRNDRAAWVDAFAKLANWDFAAQRLAAVSG